jgi:phosphoserine phosphatase RsbU/P
MSSAAQTGMNPSAKPKGQPSADSHALLQVAHLRALVDASKILNSTLNLDRLLELILEVATRELGADRGTVYLVDQQAGELRARIAQGMETRILRVKMGQGISGMVAVTGESVRIPDAYKDPRFAQNFDAKSGYRTRSMLCTPIRSKTGEIIGVIQLLNKIKGTFEVEDEVFLQALTVHVAIALENAKLHAEVVDQQRIRTELELGRQIQQNLLRPPPAQWHRYRLAAQADTCYEVGGDFYDFLKISDTTLWTIIADVSGKGISAALVMSTLQASLRALLVGVHSFERLLEQMNEMVRDFTGGSIYLTLFLALLDSESKRLHYINAGHNPPALVRADGKMELLEEGGTVLGLLPHVRYNRAQVNLHAGDVLVLYTDGVVEAENPRGDMFGMEGLARSVEATRPEVTAEAVLARIVSDVKDFSAGTQAADDQTLVVISPNK